MFGINLPEFLVILAVAVVAIGPKDLPRALYTAGKMVRKFRKMAAEFQSSFDEIMKEGELEDIVNEANKPGGEKLQQHVEQQLQAEKENKKDDATV